MTVPKLSVIEWTCLAYAVSEPGEWTNRLIWEDLGGPITGSPTRITHAVSKLRKLGFIEPFGGYRVPLEVSRLAAPPIAVAKVPLASEVLRAVSDRQPIRLSGIRLAVAGDTAVIGKAVKSLVERGVITPPNHIWPTQEGAAALAARPKYPTTKAGRPRKNR